MDSKISVPATVDDYVAQFPPDVQQIMQKLRAVIKSAAPNVEEKISYGIVGYFLNGSLLSFGAYKKHIGFYPLTAAMAALKGIKVHEGTRSSIHFPLNEPMPYDLIRKMVEVRVAEKTKSP